MLYDLKWLERGAMFPPATEIKRLANYRDNTLLFDGDVDRVLVNYRKRQQNIINKFAELGYTVGDGDLFEMDLNYFQLMTIKTGDLTVGDPPTITVSNKDIKTLKKITEYEKKLRQVIYDISRLGDSIARVYKDKQGKGNFVVSSPSMWFPICDVETKEISQHVLAWVEDLTPYAKKYERKEYALNVQIHEIGKYTAVKYKLRDKQSNNTMIMADGLNIYYDTYVIGGIIDKPKIVKTGLNDFAVIPFQNIVTPDNIYGISDYNRIITIIAELQVRYAIESCVLDKHSAPTMYGPENAMIMDRNGEWKFRTGGYVKVPPGNEPPGYMTWDASFQTNHKQIENLKKELYSLSEMGAIINDEAFGASQGYEALETRMTNAKLKARRIVHDQTEPLKKLLSLCSQIGYSDKLKPEEISIQWNEGLPINEFKESEIAKQKREMGYSFKSVLMEHFGKTEENADIEVERSIEEQAEGLTSGFSLGQGGGYEQGQQ